MSDILTQLSKLGLAGPCLEDSNWRETESVGGSAVETWSQRVNKSELGLVTFNGHVLCVQCAPMGFWHWHQISMVVGFPQCFSTEGNFSPAKIVAHAVNPHMKTCMNSCQNLRFCSE